MWKMLKHIGKTHHKRLIATFSLVGLENLLMLIYPVFGGWAINAVIEGNVWQAMLYGLVVLLMWLVGATRRVADTRTFTRIYTEIAVPVVLEQRQRTAAKDSGKGRFPIRQLPRVSPCRANLSVSLKNICRLPPHRWCRYSVPASCFWVWNFGSAYWWWAYSPCFYGYCRVLPPSAKTCISA